MFHWNEEQQQLRQQVITFARAKLGKDLMTRDAAGSFDPEGFAQCGKLGIQGLPLPEVYGGAGADIITTVAALEALGYACEDNGLIFSLGAHIWACEMPILAFGSEEQKRTYLPPMAAGEMIGGHAITEPEAGSDTSALRTVARRVGDTYVLEGNKLFVTNGPVASVLIVFARLMAGDEDRGLTAFLVDGKAEGLIHTNKAVSKMGVRTSPMGELIFDQCSLPLSARLGQEGAGSAIFNHGMEWERGFILAPAIGSMRRILEQTVKYARGRRQFGQPIGKFQSVANRIVEMRQQLEAATAALYRVTDLKQRGKLAVEAAALAKLTISEAWVALCNEALMIHGGYGYMAEFGLERQLRDAHGSRIYSGTSDIQRQIVARFMGL